MTRLSLVLVLTVTAAAAVVVVHKRPAQVRSLPASVPQPVGRASRDDVRRPLLLVGQSVLSGEGPQRPASVRRAAPASAADNLSVTAYCATGHRTASGLWPTVGMAAGNRWPFGTRLHLVGYGDVVIEDRIGFGSDVDAYFGDGSDCERRALAFGRRHLRVVVER